MKKDSFIKTDTVIVGSGVAGLFAALCLPATQDVMVITKEKLDDCDSWLAQGGVCVLKNIDDFDCYFEDTMKAGHYENNPEAVRVMIESSQDVIGTHIDLGVKFDTDGGSQIQSVKVMHSELISVSEDPVKEVFRFTGWYTDRDCTQPWDIDKDTVTDSMTLYAGWEKKE